MYSDIVTTNRRGNGAMFVLLDLSAAFDTIDHDKSPKESFLRLCNNACMCGLGPFPTKLLMSHFLLLPILFYVL